MSKHLQVTSLVATGAVVVAVFVVWGSVARAAPASPPVSAEARTLDPEARAVARLFVLTAVARKHLALAYLLAGPQIRQDLTLAEWETGMIPVIPYPLDPARLGEPKVEFAHATEAQLQVLLWSRAHRGDSQYFVIGLIKTARGWLVNAWAPPGMAAVPAG